MGKVIKLDPTSSDEELLDEINSLIDSMRSYGRIKTTLPKGRIGHEIEWSNGHAAWIVGRFNIYSPDSYWKRIGYLDLDANEFAVIGIPYQRLNRLSEDFITLPLFGGSVEQMMSGRRDLRGIDLPPALKDIAMEGVVEDEEKGSRLRMWESN